MKRRPAPVGADRDAQAHRRVRRGGGGMMGEPRHRRLAIALQGVDADVEGRAPGKRFQLGQQIGSENGVELGQHPFGHVARDMGRRV